MLTSHRALDLTGTHPEPTGPSPSLAGTTHDLALKTPYYTATVPIWLDLIASPSEWADSFLSAEAKEVLAVLGGVVVVFPLPINTGTGTGEDTNVQDNATAARDLIRGVGKVVKEGLGGWEWDGVRLCLGVGEIDDVDEWEDCCAEWGLEFVQVRSQNVPARNEFGGESVYAPFPSNGHHTRQGVNRRCREDGNPPRARGSRVKRLVL